MSGIICIDGVVGAGKTTLGEIIAREFAMEFFREPVDENPLLDKFYYDQRRYSFPLQVYFLNKRFRMLKQASQLSGCVMDRSIYGDVIFAKLLMQGGNMSSEEFALYEELLYNMLEHVSRPRLMIYLDITTDNAIARIRERGRAYEQIVPRQYWEALNLHYNAYFKHYNFSDLLTIDVNQLDWRKSKEDLQYVLTLIENKLTLATIQS
ncbi:MAG: deoxynucleoside kinase [Cytophagales bacterium]|nr:deoxynucleoside kinase [Bernardetiaceae bacterium]MDW8205666.1 deoxynucleoside kinase [Cytophagales bacterium]